MHPRDELKNLLLMTSILFTAVPAHGQTGGGTYLTIPQRTGDVWNIADHGALGDAASDSAALNYGLQYAAARASQGLATVVTAPAGTWPLTVSQSQPGFAVPSNTVLEGAANNATVFTWNDHNTGNLPSGQPCTTTYVNANPGTVCGWSLFTSPAPVNGVRNSNVVLRNFAVQGTWGPCSGCSYTGGGNNAIFLSQIDDVTLDHVTSRYSGAFGMTVRASTNLKLIDPAVLYSASDGINLDDNSGIYATQINVQHTADDCFSAHSDIYDQGGVRRNIELVGGLCFDTHAVDIASAVSTSISDLVVDSFKGTAFTFSGAMGGDGAGEGNAQGQDISLNHVLATNGLSIQSFDPNDASGAGVNYVVLGARSARAGNLNGIPGENDRPDGAIVDPYNEFLNNSNSATTPVAAWRNISITDSTFTRHFPATNTQRFANWEALKQGDIVTRDNSYNPSLSGDAMHGPGVTLLFSSVIKSLVISGNTFAGLNEALLMPSGVTGHISDFVFNDNTIIDMTSSCVDIEFGGTIDGQLVRNVCDADPYMKSGLRGTIGNWANDVALTGFYLTVPGLRATDNVFKDVSIETNVNTSDPTNGDLFDHNWDYANPVSVDSFNLYNVGIAHVHSAGFKLIQFDDNPQSATWGKVLSVPVEGALAMPTTGFWMPGEVVRNTAVSSVNPDLYWTRATLSNGGTSNNVRGVDWMPTLGSPFKSTISGSSNTVVPAECGYGVQSNDSTNDTLTIPSSGLYNSCRISISNSGSGTFTVSGSTLVASTGIPSTISNGITSVTLGGGRAAVHVVVGADGVPVLFNGD